MWWLMSLLVVTSDKVNTHKNLFLDQLNLAGAKFASGSCGIRNKKKFLLVHTVRKKYIKLRLLPFSLPHL